MSPLNHTTEDDLDIRMQLLSRRLNNLIAETEDFLAEEQKADKESPDATVAMNAVKI